jgi:hypothetical protein
MKEIPDLLSYHEVFALGSEPEPEPEPEPAPIEAETESEILLDPQEIAALAYGYWVERGSPGESTQEEKDADWFRAESCLRAGGAAAAAGPPAQAGSAEGPEVDVDGA